MLPTRRSSANYLSGYSSPWDVFDALTKTLAGSEASGSYGTDIIENQDSYEVFIDVPGFTKEQVSISVDKNELVVAGECETSEKSEEKTFLLRERSQRAFSKRFSLPKDINTEEISANIENGVLKISLAKAVEAKPKTIAIN